MSSKWLALFIFLGGLYILPFMLGYAGWYSIKEYREFLFFMPMQQLFLIGPVLYFYCKSLLNENFVLRKKDWLHFLPAMTYLLYSLIVFITDMWVLDSFYFYADGRDKDLDFWYQFAGLLSMLYYLVLSLKHYRYYRKFTVQEVSFADDIAYKWIKHFMVAFGAILLLRVLFFILNPEWGGFGSKYWYYLCFSVLSFYIAITGYSHTVKSNFNFNFREVDLHLSDAAIDTAFSADKKQWVQKIDSLFQNDAIYKDPNLTLNDVAGRLRTNRNIVSGVINQEFQMNFNDFVNKRRVEAIMKKLGQQEHKKSTLLGIALDCGFNSKATFNRAFKKHTGLTPKQFIRTKNL
ncbi:MAG: helix-turn-helix transcriptional regulator [Bacteroidota bacterium]|nr:helix-turn-helix transcriptional regulator [Bacteroidota bacterium]